MRYQRNFGFECCNWFSNLHFLATTVCLSTTMSVNSVLGRSWCRQTVKVCGAHVVDSRHLGDVDLNHFVPFVHRLNLVPSEAASQLVTQSTRHPVNSSQVNSSPGRLVVQSTRHKEAVNSSQANKQANIKAVLPQQYNYPYP